MNRPTLPMTYLAALGSVINPPRPKRRFTKHVHSLDQKQALKAKKSKRKAAKMARKRNR